MDEFLYELRILTKILEEKIEKLTLREKSGDLKNLDIKFTNSFDKIKNALEEKSPLYRPEIKHIQDLIKKIANLEQNPPGNGIIPRDPIIIKATVFKKYKSTYDFYKNAGKRKISEAPQNTSGE